MTETLALTALAPLGAAIVTITAATHPAASHRTRTALHATAGILMTATGALIATAMLTTS